MDMLVYALKWILIGMGFFSMGVSAVVMYTFSRAVYYKGRQGLLPLHVALVALSYNILLGMAVSGRISGLGDPLLRWTFYTVAVITGTAAMVVVSRHQTRVVRETDSA